VFLFFKDKPKTPPSSAADKKDEGNFRESIKELLTNKNILVLMFVFAQVQGVFNTLGTVMGDVCDSFGFSVDNSSLFGALFIGGGILGSALFGVWVEITKSYKKAVVAITFFTSMFLVANLLVIDQQNVLSYALVCFGLGASTIPIMAVSFDFGVELSYPIEESYSTGVIMSFGQFFGVIFTITTSQLYEYYQNSDDPDDEGKTKQEKGQKGFKIAFLIFIIANLIAFFCSFGVK